MQSPIDTGRELTRRGGTGHARVVTPAGPLRGRIAGSMFATSVFALVLWKLRFDIDLRGSWQLTEILINYAGGFVRRGLLGQCLLVLARHTGWDVEVVVRHGVFLMTIVNAFFVVFVTLAVRPVLTRTALLLSPAVLLFVIYDEGAYARKDVVVTLLIALHATVTISVRERPLQRERYERWAKYALPAALSVSILVHEAAALFVTHHLLLLAHTLRRGPKPNEWLLLLLPTGTAFLATVVFHGDAGTARMICDSWKAVWEAVDCGGGIGALSWDFRQARFLSWALWYLRRPALYYLAYFCLSIAPVLPLLRRSGGEEAAGVLSGVLSVAAAVAPMALFAMGWDWGRWIHLYTVSLLCVAIGRGGGMRAARRTRLPWKFCGWLCVAGYVSLWTLPYCCAVTSNTTALEKVRQILAGG